MVASAYATKHKRTIFIRRPRMTLGFAARAVVCGTAHEGQYVVNNSCKKFVMIGFRLVVFKL